MNDFILTAAQQDLVEQNLDLVNKVLARYIRSNETIYGLGREDLYQEGCVALCRAASLYDGVSARFSTYATVVIRNHLLDCCKAVSARQRNLPSVSIDAPLDDEGPPAFPEPSTADSVDGLIDQMDTTKLLTDCKQRYSGVARLGIEALELKINGFSGADIARLYHTSPNHVGAWISRAAQKMRKDFAVDVEAVTPGS